LFMASDSPAVTHDIAKEGFLKKQGNRGITWNDRYFIVYGGTLYYYKDQLNTIPAGSINLKDAIVEPQTAKRQNCFSVTLKEKDKTQTFVLAAETDEKMKKWLKAIEEAKSKPPAPVPQRTLNKKKGALFSAEKNITEMAATSTMGRKVIQEFAPPKTFLLLECFKKFTSKYYGKDKMKECEKNIYKLAVKTAMLYRGNYILPAEFTYVRGIIIKVWSSFIDFCEMKWSRDLDFMSKQFEEVYKELVKLLSPHVTPSTMNRLKDLFEFVADKATLQTFFSDDCKDLQQEALDILRDLWEKELSEQEKKSVLKDQEAAPTGNYTDPGNFVP